MARSLTLSVKIRLAAFLVLTLLPSLARAQGGQVTLIRSSVEPLPNCTPAIVGQPEPQIWDITAQVVKYCTATNTWTGASIPTLFYQTIDQGGTAQTQRPALNFINGTNMTISCVDNAGATRTDCTFTAASTAAVAFSALTPSLNNTAGTYSASGNTWDFSLASAFKVPTAGLIFPGSASGTTTFAPPASGTFTINIPAAGGTLAVSSTGPITLSALGQLNCPTCNTSGATVSSVGLTQTGSVFTITNSPVIGAGNINLAFASQAANTFLASPNGAPGALAPRTIVSADIPAINLAAAGAGGVTGILPKTSSLSTVVYTDQSNTYSTGTQSFVAATALLIPSSANYAPIGSGSIGYDTVAQRYTGGLNSTNVIFPWFISGTPVNGNCVTWSGTSGLLGQATCGSGGGGGSTNPASQFAIPYYSAVGSSTTLSGVPSPTTNGVYQVSYNITGGTASPPVISLPGIQVRANSAATDTILQSDRVGIVTEGVTATVTGPALISNIAFGLYPIGTGNATYTPVSGQVNGTASQLIPAKWFAFHYTDGSNAFMPVMPTLSVFPNAPSTPLFFTAATGAFSTATLGVLGGGTGATGLAAHSVAVNEGTSPFAGVGPQVDSVPLWQSASADPVPTAIPSCASATNAITYSTSTHTFGCNTITGGGGGGTGQIDYPVSYQTRNEPVGLSLVACSTCPIVNTGTATSIIGTNYSGRAIVQAGTMIPAVNGVKTMRVHATGTLGTNSTNFALTITVSLGGVTLSTITVPTIASLGGGASSTDPWELDYHFTVTSLTTAAVGGCFHLVGTASADLIGCASSASATGLNFTADQLLDIKATWTTANAANSFTVNQLAVYPVHTI